MKYITKKSKTEFKLLILNNDLKNEIKIKNINLGYFIKEYKDYFLFAQKLKYINNIFYVTKNNIERDEIPNVFSVKEYRQILINHKFQLPRVYEFKDIVNNKDLFSINQNFSLSDAQNNIISLDHIYYLNFKNNKYFRFKLIEVNRVYFK